MPADTSDGYGTYTIGCSFEKLIPDAQHKDKIRDAVHRAHLSVIYATELLNLHIRRVLEEDAGADLKRLFTANWLLKVFNAVTRGTGTADVPDELTATRDKFMSGITPPCRKGLTQVLLYEGRNLSAVAHNNVWMHFRRRVDAHVRLVHRMSEREYTHLSIDERKRRKLTLLQTTDDLLRTPGTPLCSPHEMHSWIEKERARLGVDDAVGDWDGKPLLYHLKTSPWKFVNAMRLMSLERETAGRGSIALFPLRRSMVPRHIRLDQRALREILGLGASAYNKEQSRKRQKGSNSLSRDDDGCSETHQRPKRKRRSEDDLMTEKRELFSSVIDLRSAHVKQPERFQCSLTTDGVCARLLYERPGRRRASSIASIPSRGMWCIDELKRLSRSSASQFHVVGIDPGIRELVCAVDQDDSRNSAAVRYTLRQRLKDRRSAQYAAEVALTKPGDVGLSEQMMSETNSRASSTLEFGRYVNCRHSRMAACLEFYGAIEHRRRRWKSFIKLQQSEERLYSKLRSLHDRTDDRVLVLAYGAWGAHDASSCIKRGNAPAIGVGLARKLSQRFLVATTPEHGTSSTCCKCLGPSGAWKEKETEWKKKVRGLRVCQNEGCRCPLNRDRSAATLIGLNFTRLLRGEASIRNMTEEDREFLRLNVSNAVR